MFKLLVEIFKREDLLQQAYDMTIDMLKSETKMFYTASASLHNDSEKATGEEYDIYAEDRVINEYQRVVRRKVVAHLATSTSRDIVFGLMLVSIIIDVERLGDYAKNIMDLAREHPEPLNYYNFNDQIMMIEKEINERFIKLSHAFESSDEDVAKEIMKVHGKINSTCDSILKTMIQENQPDIPSNEAATLTLYVRYLKRTSAHITNIASSIVNTFDNIGFSNKKSDEDE